MSVSIIQKVDVATLTFWRSGHDGWSLTKLKTIFFTLVSSHIFLSFYLANQATASIANCDDSKVINSVTLPKCQVTYLHKCACTLKDVNHNCGPSPIIWRYSHHPEICMTLIKPAFNWNSAIVLFLGLERWRGLFELFGLWGGKHLFKSCFYEWNW